MNSTCSTYQSRFIADESRFIADFPGLDWLIHQLVADQWVAALVWLAYSVPMLLATFGPTCALVFGMPTLPSSQPLNGIGKLPGAVVLPHVAYGCCACIGTT